VYRLKLEDEKRNLKTLLELNDRYEKLGKSNVLSRYRLYKLMVQLQNWFEKSKVDSAYISGAVSIDRKVSRFYAMLYDALGMLKDIWQALQASPVDFVEVEDKYVEVIKAKI